MSLPPAHVELQFRLAHRAAQLVLQPLAEAVLEYTIPTLVSDSPIEVLDGD
ncbi:MAG: hypothetical protein GY713_11300 [Actinomycetia bacterium]|nr:hypothetical protein [Actinomycetes bacterium]